MNRAEAAPAGKPEKSSSGPTKAPRQSEAGPTQKLRVELLRIAGLCALTVLLMSLIFPPGGFWPLALVCLVPWALAACLSERAWVFNWLSFAAGWAFFLINLRWLMPVTGLGYSALAFYLALYWPLAGWAIRTGRRNGIRVFWTLPIVWVACEYLRAWVMSGIPWLFLSHVFYQKLIFIQISDLGGAYGVSFVVAMVNALVVEFVLGLRRDAVGRRRWKHAVVAGLTTAVVVAATLVYGRMRLAHPEFEEGPRVAVVQDDIPMYSNLSNLPFQFALARYLVQGVRAARQDPDLLVFPETAWGATQNREFLQVEHNAVPGMDATTWRFGMRCDRIVSALARGDYRPAQEAVDSYLPLMRAAARDPEYAHLPMDIEPIDVATGPPTTVLLGAVSVETYTEPTYPESARFNSALVYGPDGEQRADRYDKTHLVPFGEYVPFRGTRYFHWLYLWLNSLSPFSGPDGKHEYSLSAGERYTVFELPTEGRTYRFGTPICYEDVMPYVIREYVWDGPQRRVDFLVNISNDGWFLHSDELTQHLAICVFRAVENRIGIARAVNTGISGFIDPDGRMYSLVKENGRLQGAGITGVQIDRMRLDQRASLYGRHGDWFAMLCLALSIVLWLDGVFERWISAAGRRISQWRGKRGVRNA